MAAPTAELVKAFAQGAMYASPQQRPYLERETYTAPASAQQLMHIESRIVASWTGSRICDLNDG